jgi:peptidoglycan/LPS O-acetylase OafA/YrhL
MATKRTTALLTVLVLLLVLGIGHLFVPFVPDAEKIPPTVRYGDIVLGILSLITAIGLWNVQRWATVLTTIIAALNILSAAPGIVAAPNSALRVVTAVYVVLSLLIIILIALRSARWSTASRVSATQE